MKKTIYLMLSILGITSFVIASANAQQVNLSSPEATVNSFVASINQYNFKQAALCVAGAKPEAVGQIADLEQEIKKEKMIFSISNLRSSINGLNAKITLSLKMTVPTWPSQAPLQTEHLQLRQEKGKWKILPGNPKTFLSVIPNNGAFTWLATLLAHPELGATIRDRVQAATCMSNVKQLALAMSMFVYDHDNTFAITASSPLEKTLWPYVRNKTLFHCPSAKKETTDDASSYSFNANLENIQQASIKDPAKTILLYEGKDGKFDFRHNGKASVAFVNGVVKFIGPEEAESLHWKP